MEVGACWPQCAHDALTMVPSLDRSAVRMRSECGHCAVLVRLLCCHCAATVLPATAGDAATEGKSETEARQKRDRSGKTGSEKHESPYPLNMLAWGLRTMDFCDARNPEKFGLERETGFEPATHCLGTITDVCMKG